ncbi:MAG TPA: electron transport complex subunit RsxE [Longimicrobiales bacterium]|nr:electron transport complex subunit RsxE [Longimicrobiales bacterium]
MSGTSSDAVRATCHSSPARPTRQVPARKVLTRGIWKENPVLVQAMGLCPSLAVTNTVANSLTMGLATLFVLVSSSLMVSSMKRLIPDAIRISGYVLIIATFVTIAQLFMAATVPELAKALGPYVFLIVVNCIILGRQEAFASKQPVAASLLDAFGTSFGFILALLMMGSLRELLASGSLLGVRVLPASFQPWAIMALPPGGFFAIGFILLGLNAWNGRKRKVAGTTIRTRPHGVLSQVKQEAA